MSRVYASRRLNRPPRAMARRVFPDVLEIPELPLGFANAAALVYLPRECEVHLAAMASAPCAVHVHRDVGLQGQAAYVSLAAPALAGHYQPALWLELNILLQMHTENSTCEGAGAVPLILVAGNSLVIGQFNPEGHQLLRCREAIAMAAKPPVTPSAQELEKAQRVVQNYGERPWLHMSFEMRIADKRLAVTWAPFDGEVPDCVLC
ncbi:MAG: hypothetical protein Q7T07_01410 [Burkholderiaceae bacterium]|nr:hypothetical protein [Burkholderiaceae bacterium]